MAKEGLCKNIDDVRPGEGSRWRVVAVSVRDFWEVVAAFEG